VRLRRGSLDRAIQHDDIVVPRQHESIERPLRRQSGQAAGASFVERLGERRDDLDGVSGPGVANAQMAAFREWERFTGERFAELHTIVHPTLVVNGVHDEMIPIANSYRLVEHLPNAVLLAYPDAGHGSLFQYHEAFARQAAAFLSSSSESAAY